VSLTFFSVVQNVDKIDGVIGIIDIAQNEFERKNSFTDQVPIQFKFTSDYCRLNLHYK
jgi:hypothetical protein